MDTLKSPVEPCGPRASAESSSRLDALAALRAYAELALRAGAVPLMETYARVLEVTLAHLGAARGMLVLVELGREPSHPIPPRELARAGIGEDETTALLSRVALPVAEPISSADTPSLLEWAICPLPTAGTATPVLITACDPPSLDHQERLRAAFSVLAPGAAAAVAAALREELLARGEAEAEHLKAELISTVSHELRNPLASVTGYATTLLRYEQRLSRRERQEFLRAILTAGERLALLIDRMLEMSQLGAGTVPLRMAPLDLAQLAREALAVATPHVPRTGTLQGRITLRLRVVQSERGDPPPLVWGDARRIRDVLDHVLENAIKYSPDGGEIEISLRRAPTSTLRLAMASGMLRHETATEAESLPAMVELCVSDTGVGIPADHLDHIFDRFHQVDTRLTRVTDGLGLGLAICKRIIELHGGAIWSESTLGVGSTFHIVLPAAQATGDEPTLI